MADFKPSLLITAIMSCFAAGCGGGGAHFSTVNDSQNANTTSETATPAESAPEPQQTPEETKTEEQTPPEETQQNSQMEVQVIDGYLENIEVCIIKNEALDCDERFGTAKTDGNGKVFFELTPEQKNELAKLKSVKFKAVSKKGSTDIVLGKKTETTKDIVLLGTKFFKSDDLNSELDNENTSGKSFKLTPFTTMTEMIHSGQASTSEEYEETMKKIAESLGTDLETIQSDYNNAEGDNKEQNVSSLLAGELMASLNMLPKTNSEITATKNKDEILSITLQNLDSVKTHAEELKETLLGVDGAVKDDADLTKAISGKLKVLNTSFVSLSTGLADEWRCGVTKANEVWCWGNNAWNNLGNQEFTQSKLNVEKYSIEDTDVMMYLKNNYSAKPLPVLIKNPDKKTDEAPEYIHLSGITKVATSNIHGCAITLNREVYCWGGNYNGQLGTGKEEFLKSMTEPVGYAGKVVAGKQNSKSGYLSNVVDLSLGQNHSCALTAEGDIYCWGDNTAYELGAAHENDRMHKPIRTMS
ncbi:MAG: hypothetical protein J6P43_04975, partial [Succinivibrionaceae bacterium]|nr:hypothetical protein [Succinivibrionaceae bacterium]